MFLKNIKKNLCKPKIDIDVFNKVSWRIIDAVKIRCSLIQNILSTRRVDMTNFFTQGHSFITQSINILCCIFVSSLPTFNVAMNKQLHFLLWIFATSQNRLCKIFLNFPQIFHFHFYDLLSHMEILILWRVLASANLVKD